MLKKKAKRRTSPGEKAITLIALVVTIVILLILAAVTITMTLGENGLFQRSKAAKDATIKAMSDEEVELAVSNLKMEATIRKLTQEGSRKFLEDDLKKSDKDTTVTINGNDLKIKHRGNNYNVDQDFNLADEGDFDAVEWDKTAAPENVFVWKSDDPNDEGYNTIIGYKATVDNYPILRYPSRCKIIEEDSYETYYRSDFEQVQYGYDGYVNLIRSYTSNIKKKEFPETITEISGEGFYYNNVESLKLPKSLKKIGDYAFSYYSKLGGINIPKGVNTIGKYIFRNCSCLSSISILGNINQINEHAFDRYRWDDTFDVSIIFIKGAKNSIKGAPWGAENAKIVWDCGKEYMTIAEKKEWDKTAVPENMFYWKSDNPNDIEYHTIIGYKKNIDNYTILRYPTRCQAIEEDPVYESSMLNENNPETVRDFTRNIKKIEYPDTIIIMATAETYMRGFINNKTESIRLPKSLKLLDDSVFSHYNNLKNIYIYKDIEYIGNHALSSSITTIRMQGKADSISGAPWGAYNATVNWNCDSEQ